MSRTAKVSAYDRVEHDFYVEPAWSVRALLAVEAPFDGVVMDPCCGTGTIPLVLAQHNIRAFGADIVDRSGRPGHNMWMVDDFRQSIPWWRPATIISNPPYSCWEEVVSLGLDHGAERVCLILPLRYLEGISRSAWYDRYPICRFWAFSQRVDMPPRGEQVTVKKRGNKQYAWYVWERGHNGPYYQGGKLPLMDKIT